jgi:hypothetical protein
MTASVVALDGHRITISRGEGEIKRVLNLEPEEVHALREHFRSEVPDTPEGTRALHPIIHAGGSGYIDFDGWESGQTVVTLRVLEDSRGEVTLQVNLWGGDVALEVER